MHLLSTFLVVGGRIDCDEKTFVYIFDIISIDIL